MNDYSSYCKDCQYKRVTLLAILSVRNVNTFIPFIIVVELIEVADSLNWTKYNLLLSYMYIFKTLPKTIADI